MRYFVISFTANFGQWNQVVESYPWSGQDDPSADAVEFFVKKWLDPQAIDVNMIGFSEFTGPNAVGNFAKFVEFYNARKNRLLTNHVATVE